MEDYADSIHLAGPFQLLLVSRRFADAAVQSLWKGLVFHGHDPVQVRTLLSTLNKDDGVLDGAFEPVRHQFSALQRLKEVNEDENEISDGVEAPTVDQGRTHEGRGVFNSPLGLSSNWLETFNISVKRFQVCLLGTMGNMSATSAQGHLPHTDPQRNFARQRNDTQSVTLEDSSPGSQSYFRRHSASGLESTSLFSNVPWHEQEESLLTTTNCPRWSYRRFVRRVVLNFSHPQASPQLLIQILETLESRCNDKIQALDLHANEKMRGQGSGLEKSADLERLFGSTFKNLKHLRLQGGFLDNQLLSAIIYSLSTTPYSSKPPMWPSSSSLSPSSSTEAPIMSNTPAKGRSPISDPRYSLSAPLQSPTQGVQYPPCRLSQVFLGPGSITDSAIEKLIAAAGQSLEVFTVTSCVDVSGGALASLLIKCPKLRVLGVYRSLARDKELLEGLGLEMTSDGQVDTTLQGDISHATAELPLASHPASPLSAHKESTTKSRHRIIAPLERLELGTVKLTTVGVTEVLKGTCQTLRFLVLETKHFNGPFLQDVIVPMCNKLEGLYFDDLEYLQRLHQRGSQRVHTTASMQHGDGQHGAEAISVAQATQYHHHQPRATIAPNQFFEFGRPRQRFYMEPVQRSSRSWHQSKGNSKTTHIPSTINTRSVSAWLGETSVREWVDIGECAFWASAPASTPVHLDINSVINTTTGLVNIDGNDIENQGDGGFYSMAPFDGSYVKVLERFNMDLSTIDVVTQSLHRLQKFAVMQMVLVTDTSRSASGGSGRAAGKTLAEQQSENQIMRRRIFELVLMFLLVASVTRLAVFSSGQSDSIPNILK
ncbi:hypothetical protein BG004_001899 [Podila humilis]|nr:hypothetical protein BG004_001899 [Podila humilis]